MKEDQRNVYMSKRLRARDAKIVRHRFTKQNYQNAKFKGKGEKSSRVVFEREIKLDFRSRTFQRLVRVFGVFGTHSEEPEGAVGEVEEGVE